MTDNGVGFADAFGCFTAVTGNGVGFAGAFGCFTAVTGNGVATGVGAAGKLGPGGGAAGVIANGLAPTPGALTGRAWAPGSVPGRKASRLGPTLANLVPGGARKSMTGMPLSASCMNSIKTGRAATAPVSPLPRDRLSSKPTNTPTTICGEKPMNQALRKSLVVPVLPPNGRPRLLAWTAVPRCTTPSSIVSI